MFGKVCRIDHSYYRGYPNLSITFRYGSGASFFLLVAEEAFYVIMTNGRALWLRVGISNRVFAETEDRESS